MSYQFTPGYNVADLTTTLTLDVWNDKLVREDRARREWHKRWGPAFGLSSRPDTPEPELRRVHPSQERPPSSGLAQTVPLEAATLKYNAAIAQTHMIPGRPPSVASVRSLNDRASQRCSVRSGASGASIPGVGAFSVTSSSKARKELLLERQEQLKMQLKQVEAMLGRAAPSTNLSINSADWQRPATSASVRSTSSHASRASNASDATRRQNTRAQPRLGRAQPHHSTAVDAVIVPQPRAHSSLAYNAAEYAVPLCLPRARKEEAFKSRAGAGFSLPGARLSASMTAFDERA